jgi:probable rRNA maturation factor
MINVSVEIDPTLKGPDPKQSKKILVSVLETESVVDSKINVIFGDDKLLNSLKIEFFNYDHLTDVIAFRINDYNKPEIEGEIYISLARAIENAKKYGEPLSKELARLIIHGGLHLLDHKDKTDDEKNKMTALEDKYLQQVDWNNLI